MAGRTPKQAKVDEEMMGSIWQWAEDIQKASGYAVQVAVLPTRRKGVWAIVARAHDVVDGKARGVAAKVTREWPTSAYSSITGAVLGAVMQLAKVLEEDALRRPQ